MTGFFWLASYPKSGNTWLRLALWSLKNDGAAVDFSARPNFAPIASSRLRFDAVLGVESSDLGADEIAILRPRVYEAMAQAANEPMLSKVHDAWTLTPAGEPMFPPAVTLGTVYVVRDPRDVAVSFANHMGEPVEWAVDFLGKATAQLATPQNKLAEQLPQCLMRWSEHVESWLGATGPAPLLLRYEDMLADPVRELSRVVAYLGWSAHSEAVERAVAATRFETLRAAEERHGFHEAPPQAERFFRRGKAGGWRDTLTADQAARIERDHHAVMRRLGYL